MAIFSSSTLVTDPTTGNEVEFGSLSASAQNQILSADEAEADAQLGPSFTNFKASTGTASYDARGAIGPSFAGGYAGEPTYSFSGGGYDPNNPNGYVDSANSIGGAGAISDPTAYAPSFAGGYYGEQTGGTGGGYDPVTGVNQSDSTNSIGGSRAISQDYNVGADFRGGYYGDQIEESGGGYDPNSEPQLNDPSTSRLAGAGNPDVSGGGGGGNVNVEFASSGGLGDNMGSGPGQDWRVRVSLASGSKIFYKDSSNALMKPLTNTDGVIFPYVPQLSITHAANYSSITPTHSNYPHPFYNNSEVQDISITGDFTVQNTAEGQYLLAAIYFFRAATKMFFGSGINAGNPPPIVFLDGYGSHYLPHVPCVITSFSHSMGPDVDYIEIESQSTQLREAPVNQTANGANYGVVSFLDNNGLQNVPSFMRSAEPRASARTSGFAPVRSFTRMPTLSSITVNLKPIYSRRNLHDRFNLDRFAAGGLLQDSKAGYGGFI